jgi:hypothetical protein
LREEVSAGGLTEVGSRWALGARLSFELRREAEKPHLRPAARATSSHKGRRQP